ncbi:hypothetical protein FMH13_15275 [Vibrio cholerae]|nr:hypothetical protein [Vibrio cholerae]
MRHTLKSGGLMYNILVLGRNSISSKILIHNISKEHNVFWCAEVRDDKFKLVLNRIKRFGFLHVISQLMFQVLQKFIYRFSSKRISEIVNNIACLNYSPDLSLSNVNSQECRDILDKQQKFDLVLLSGTRIISQELIDYFNGTPIVNIHAGITPAYRGVHGGYWALVSGDLDNFGATIHFVDKGIDTGKKISCIYVKPTSYDNFSTYPLLQQVAAVEVLMKHIPDIIEKNILDGLVDDVSSNNKVWSHPGFFEYIYNYFRYGVK